MDTLKFIRKPFEIEAIQITEANMEELTNWCQGTIETTDGGSKYIKVRVHYPLTPRQTKGFVGDWLLYSRRGYKVYTDGAFKQNFIGSNAEVEQKLDKIFVNEGGVSNVFEDLEEIQTPGAEVDAKDAVAGKK